MKTPKKGWTRREFLKPGLVGLAGGAALAACSSDNSDNGQPASTATPSGPTPTPSPEPIRSSIEQTSVRILWTGDIHGHLRPIYHRDPFDQTFLAANGIEPGSVEAYVSSSVDFPELAEKYGKVGGWANIATLIKQERGAAPDRTILLDSGDTWYGSAICLKTEGKAAVDIMNAIGYDALTLHWELNLGQETFLQRVAESNFAVLAQNLVDTDFEDRVLEASLIKDIDGVRVAIVGEAYPFTLLTTEDRDDTPGFRMGYRDLELQEEIDRVREEEGAQIVILLSHMGYLQDIAMAERLVGVDVIVGGHTHDITWRPYQVGQTLIVHAGSHGKFLGKLDLEITDGKIAGYDHTLMPVLADEIEPDPEVAALIDEIYAPFEEELSEVIGETTTMLYRASLFGGTTDSFIGRAYREIMESDLACTGGWRFGSTLLPGPITVGDVYDAMKPTPTPIFKADLLGSQIRATIEDNLDNAFAEDPLQRLGGDVLRCTGIKAGFRRDGPRMGRLSDPMIKDEPLDDEKVYTVATSGGRSQNRDPDPEESTRPAVEELVVYIQENSPIASDAPMESFTDIS